MQQKNILNMLKIKRIVRNMLQKLNSDTFLTLPAQHQMWLSLVFNRWFSSYIIVFCSYHVCFSSYHVFFCSYHVFLLISCFFAHIMFVSPHIMFVSPHIMFFCSYHVYFSSYHVGRSSGRVILVNCLCGLWVMWTVECGWVNS